VKGKKSGGWASPTISAGAPHKNFQGKTKKKKNKKKKKKKKKGQGGSVLALPCCAGK